MHVSWSSFNEYEMEVCVDRLFIWKWSNYNFFPLFLFVFFFFNGSQMKYTEANQDEVLIEIFTIWN